MSEGNMKISVDRLPLKRLAAVEENGTEHFVTEVSQEEKQLNLLRRIDFGMEQDAEKPKSSNENQPWKIVVENMHLAQQELSYALDLISHVVTDNVASFFAAGRILMASYPTIYWTPCAAHCLDLLLEDIGIINWISMVVRRAKIICKFIYMNSHVRHLFLEFSKGVEIVRPATTRFAINFILLESIQSHKSNLMNMFVSEKYRNDERFARARRLPMGKVAKRAIWDETQFWHGVRNCISVEANDAIAVAGMTRPKQQPNELLSDLAISASTKLQAFRNIGKYMKQTSKALEEQVAREARFYGALMRLQRNWKVKRQRLISAGPGGSAGFTIDLSDHIAIDPLQTSFSAVHVDQDNSGMLAVNRTEGSNHVLHVGFQGGEFGHKLWESIKMKLSSNFAAADEQQGQNQELEKGQGKGIGERVDEGAKQAHSILRETQCAVSDEKVFNLVAQAAFDSSSAISVTGIRENFLKLRLSPEMFLTIALLPAVDNEREIKDDHHSEEKHRGMINGDFFKSFGSSNRLPNPLSSEVYLQQIFHQHAVAKMHGCRSIRLSSHTPIKSEGGLIESQMSDTVMWLKHFCMTLSHRIYCYKVISEMEKLVRVPYLHLFTHPTWHCCMSEWYLYLKVPEIVTQGGHVKTSEGILRKKRIRSQFHCKIVVHGEQLTIEAEGTPNIGCLFKGSPAAVCLKSEYSCGLSDLASMLLQQVASQLIYWLHEEALVVGMKVTRDYLSLSFQLDDGDSLSLVAGIDLHGYCVIWWLIMNDTKVDNGLGKYDPDGNNMDKKRYLGPLQLETLYAVLMDLVTLCGKNGEF